MKPKQIKDYFTQALKSNDVLHIYIKNHYFVEIGTYAEKDLWSACLGETDDNECGHILINVERHTWELAVEDLLYYMKQNNTFSTLLSQ